MPEAVAAALATPGLPILILAALVAGMVYGFAGFGAALIFMPIGVRFLDPLSAVAAFQLSALASLFSVVPQAWGQADRRAAGIMLGASVLAAPLGIWVLRTGDPEGLRWAVSAVVLITLTALLTGWRFKGTPGVPGWLGVGAGVGFLGGSVGLNGPALILFQLAGRDPVERTRANTILVLTLSSLLLLPLMALQGALSGQALAIGAMLFLPYLIGGWLGRLVFDPSRAGLYRWVAYGIIAAAGLMGLPIWGR